MVDVKQVAIALDTSPLLRGEQALARLETAGRRTDASIGGLERQVQRAGGSMAGLSRANQQVTVHQTAFGRSTSQAATSLGGLTRTYDQATVRATAFGRATANAAQQTQAAARGLTTAGAQAGRAGQQMNSAAGYTGNLAAQFNDIGVQLASGQSPLLLAVQQGTQINQVLAQMGRGGGAIKALGAAFASILSPMSLVTIGIIAGGAALGQWALKAISAKVETRSLADLTEDLTDRTQSYQDAADSVLMSIDDQADAYGSLADEMRGVVEVQAELARGAAQEALDRLTASLGRGTEGGLLQRALAANPMTDIMQAFTGRDATERFFQIPAETTTRVEALLGGFRQMNEELQEAKGNAAEQNRIMRQMVPLAKSLADEYGGITKQERAFLEGLTQAADQSARIVATTEEIVVSSTRLADTSQRSLQWADQTLARMQAQTAASQTIAEYGANSAQVMDQQALAARAALAAELERRGIVGETAEALRAALVAQQEAKVVAEERMRFDREIVRIEREKEQSAQRQLQLDLQRQHAEAAISQRLQNRIQVARAIVVHGKDSVQAKLAEEAVSRRLFELDLERQGITGEIRDQLVAQYEAAAQLEGQIVQAQPAFQGLSTTINGIANAWGEFVVTGFQDFRSFTRKVFDAFKQLLVQMIATAARNKIMIGIGMGGSGGAGTGGGGMLGGLGGMFGGGGGGGGPLGMIGNLFGGGGGGGGGLFGGLTSGPFGGGLKNAAFNLGLIHGPAIAGGGAAALASGAATSTAFGFGPAAGIGAGGLGAGGGAVAATGLTAAGAAALAVGGIALVGLALMKTSKEIDKGAKLLVEGLEATAEGYTTIETSQFFGLSKRVRDRDRQLDSGYQASLVGGAQSTIREVQALSSVMNLATDSLSDYSAEIKLSVLESEGAAEAFAEISDGMAQMVLEANGLSVGLDGAGERLRSLGLGLASVMQNSVRLEQQTRLNRSLSGALVAEQIIEAFGGVQDYMQQTAAFYQEFFTEGERAADQQRTLNRQLRNAGVDTIPTTIQGYRDLANAQDLMTESGRALYSTLIELAPQFAEVANFREGVFTGARESLLTEPERQREAQARLTAFSEEMGAWAVTGERGRKSMLEFIESAQRSADAGREWGLEMQGQLPALVDDFNLLRSAAGQAASELSSVRGGGGGGGFEDPRAGGPENEYFFERATNRARRHMSNLQASYLSGLARTEEELRQLHNPRLLYVDPNWRFGREAAEPSIVQVFRKEIRKAVLNVEDYRRVGLEAARQAHLQTVSYNFFKEQSRRGTGPYSAGEWATMAQQAKQIADAQGSLAARALEQARQEINFGEFLATMQHLGTAFDATGSRAREFAAGIFDIFENVSSFQQAAASYYQNFFTEGERRSRLRDELQLSFDLLGVAMPKTRSEFRQLVEQQDLTTHSSRRLFAGLLDLSDEFAQLAKPMSGLADSANNLNEALGASQRIFRSLREEAVYTSAGTSVSGAPSRLAGMSEGQLQRLIAAINSGNITIVRRLDEIRETERRTQREPTRAAV